MKATVLLFIPILTISMSCFSQTESIKKEIRDGIDWMYRNEGAPTRATTYLRSVPIGNGYRSIRGPLSAKSCLMYATIFAFAGENNYAIISIDKIHGQNTGKRTS